jgi:hypothetical protein
MNIFSFTMKSFLVISINLNTKALLLYSWLFSRGRADEFASALKLVFIP